MSWINRSTKQNFQVINLLQGKSIICPVRNADKIMQHSNAADQRENVYSCATVILQCNATILRDFRNFKNFKKHIGTFNAGFDKILRKSMLRGKVYFLKYIKNVYCDITMQCDYLVLYAGKVNMTYCAGLQPQPIHIWMQRNPGKLFALR